MEMATPGELVRSVAGVLGLPANTLVVHDRALAEAGLRSKAGRGRGSAHVTARDAAHLLTAVLASSLIKDSAQAVARYAETRPHRQTSSQRLFKDSGIAELARLPSRHSFIDALEALIAAATFGSLAKARVAAHGRKRPPIEDAMPMIEVATHSPGIVGDIRISGTQSGNVASVRYLLPDPWDKKAGRRRPSEAEIAAWEASHRRHRVDSDLEQYRRISGETILNVAGALANEKETG